MKKIVCTKPGVLTYEHAEKPQPEAGRAVIRIRRVGICGTDLHAFEGSQPYFDYPRVLGHELSGELIDIGGNNAFSPGEAVTFIPYYSCGHCVACRKARTNCCVSLQVCGVHTDGGMAEFFSVPSSLLLKGAGLSFDQLALVEPLAVGAHSVRRAGVASGETVLVVGAGPIGLGVAAFARLAGARVLVLDLNKHRLSFVEGAETLHPNEGDVSAQLHDLSNGQMPDVVMDATGSLAAINGAFRYMAHGGRYVLVGLQKGDITFSHPEFHKREGTLLSSRNATREDFEFVIASIQNRAFDPLRFITHRVEFDRAVGEFESWLNRANGVVKAMIELA